MHAQRIALMKFSAALSNTIGACCIVALHEPANCLGLQPSLVCLVFAMQCLPYTGHHADPRQDWQEERALSLDFILHTTSIQRLPVEKSCERSSWCADSQYDQVREMLSQGHEFWRQGIAADHGVLYISAEVSAAASRTS